MIIFAYMWLIILIVAYITWTIYVFKQLKGWHIKPWFLEGDGGTWFFANVVGVFFASIMYFAYFYGK